MANDKKVKFWRGLISSYNELTSKDANSIYFAYSADGKTGALYLGTNLIAEVNDTKTDAVNDLIAAAIQGLDSSVNNGDNDLVKVTVTEVDGKLTELVLDDSKLDLALAGKKTTQTAVEDKGLTGATVLKNLSQNANGDISYETRDLTPADIGAQPAGSYQPAGDYQPKGDYKTKQTPVVDPTANGQTVAFIDSITQDENGEIVVTKKTVSISELGLSSAMHYVGAFSEAPSSAVAGDVYLNTTTKKEYIYDDTNGWVELGDEGSHALKTITIEGTGYLTGGGNLAENRTIDIASNIKTKIDSIDNKKDRQEEYSETGSTTKTITNVTQNANGEIDITYEDIAFPEYGIEEVNLENVTDGNKLKVTVKAKDGSSDAAEVVVAYATAAGDAAKLGGKDAADYASKEDIGTQVSDGADATGLYASIQGNTKNTVADCVGAIGGLTDQLTWNEF